MRTSAEPPCARCSSARNRLRLAGGDAEANKVETFLTSFFGVTSGSSTRDALEVVRGLAKPNAPRYCSPGDAPVQPEGTSAQLFVLGPPRDEKLLAKDSVAATSPEVYGLQELLGIDSSGIDLSHFDPVVDGADPGAPFDAMQTIPTTVAQQMPFFARRYWGSDVDPSGDGPDWRRIDTSFLTGATELALQLDSSTNNTSLVLAIRLDDGDVLLFPADAQIGSWLSWQNLSWTVDGKQLTGPDLLGRVVFYKVGHHGSHNATLKAHGLEMMDSLQLAMIPVDEAMARKKNWNRMPLKDLVTALQGKTHGAVVRADQPLPEGVPSVAASPDGELWYEVTL